MIVSLNEWNEFLKQFPSAHLLQTGAWGELKSQFGWKAERLVSGESGAQLLFRRLPLGFSIGYLAKGPVGALGTASLYEEMDTICRKNRAIFLKLEPDLWEDDQTPAPFPFEKLISSKPVQPRRTVVVSLQGSEEEILARMKPKTRYNIRLAEKKRVVVRVSEDIPGFQRMAEATARRDAFGVHTVEYYKTFYQLFYPSQACELLMAFYEDQPLASLFVARNGERAYYLYGASYELERNRMPTYLLQWEAMKWARSYGCRDYDLWGIPDLEEDELENSFQGKESHDGLWGVYRFKRGFGGEIKRSVGSWDRVYHSELYQLYTFIIKKRGGQED